MTIDPQPNSQSAMIQSQSDFDRFCAECCWHGMDMANSHPVSPGHCLDVNCSNNSRHDPTALEPHHPPQSGCELDVTCCEAEDCASPACTTICDGFVDCDRSTACSPSHCDDAECRDVATACYDENCVGHDEHALEQITHDILNQNNNSNDNPLEWDSSSSYHLDHSHPHPHSLVHAHANCLYPAVGYGRTSGQEEGQRSNELSPADNNNQAVLKSMDINYHVSPHCTSGKLPHVFDSSMCGNQGYLVPANVLHCAIPDPCYRLDACNQQCNFGQGFPSCPTDSHLGFVPFGTPHSHIPYHPPHEQFLLDAKMPGVHSCHHDHRTDTAPPASSPPTHTPALSIGSSPISPAPDNRAQSIPSTSITSPDLLSSATEELPVCRWMHKNSDGTSTLCGASFQDTASLQEHLVHTHADAISGSQGQGFYCCWEGCHRPTEPFSQKSKLQGHFLTHSNHKNFQCPTCGKAFARQATLERHERSHRGDKPFACTVCKKTFTDSSELKTHLRTHTGEKPFKCNFPGCTFETGDSSNMSSHKLTHGVRKHKCPFPRCSKSFTRPDQLKRHLKSSHKAESIPLDDRSPSSTRAPSVTSC